MKNQYFGDMRDLFEYDLLLDLVKSHGSGRLTSIPMLTPNDGSREGSLTAVSRGRRREVLYNFFRDSIAAGKRDIRLMHQLMEKLGIHFMALRDTVWFEHEQRSEYFTSVPSEFLTDSVLLLDPDVGLETGSARYRRRRGPEKYLLYFELEKIWTRTSPGTVMVVNQHLQNNDRKRVGDIEKRLADLTKLLKSPAWAIQWNNLAFLVATRDAEAAPETKRTVKTHADRHQLRFFDSRA